MGYDDDAVDDSQLWEPNVNAVPPVIGRVNPDTREPVMRYETAGEVSDSDRQQGSDDWFQTDDGIDVNISF
jgi:hypothetical protein